ELVLRNAGEPLGGRLAAGRIHAHVERPFAREGKTALGVVELRRRYAEIEQHAAELGAGEPGTHDRLEVLEPRMHDREARIGAESSTPRSYRFRILVQREQTPLSAKPCENFSAVPSAAERGVDVRAVRRHRETVERFVHQPGLMFGFLAHPLWRSTETAIPVLEADPQDPRRRRRSTRLGERSTAPHPTARTCCLARSASRAARDPRTRAAHAV